jgi:hypothetical protein
VVSHCYLLTCPIVLKTVMGINKVEVEVEVESVNQEP